MATPRRIGHVSAIRRTVRRRATLLEDEFDSVFNTDSVATAILDKRGNVKAVNRRWTELAGSGVAPIVLATASGRPSWRGALDEVLRGRRSRTSLDEDVNDGGVVRRWRTTVEAASGTLGAVVRCEDVSDQALMQRILRRQSDMINAIDESLPVVMFERFAAGDDWEYRFSNDRFVELFGIPAEELWESAGAFAALLHEDDRERVLGSYRHIVTEGGGVWHAEFRAVTTRGSYAYFRAAVHIEVREGREFRSCGFLQDVSQERAGWNEARELRTHDALTGLRTRSHFEGQVAEALERWADGGRSFAVIEFDIDDFREVNQSHGIEAGDEVLKCVARMLKDVTPPAYEVSRVGGDRFAAIVEAPSAEAARAFAQDVVERLSTVYDVRGVPIHIRASAGVAVPRSVQTKVIELLSEAALAQAVGHDAGGGRALVFSPDMAEEAAARIALKRELRSPSITDQLVLFYQPKVDLRSGVVAGCEGLVRWNHPTRGLLPPSAFLAIAEATGAIVHIGEWVIREACRQAVRWRDDGLQPGPIAINVSPIQLVRADLFECALRAIEDAGAPRGAIDIEVTESAFIHFSDELVNTLQRVRDLGISIALDDFGMGYSSLAYVRRLPLSVIKIDQTFVRGAIANDGDAAIVRWVTRLGLELGLDVIAEGIETAAELDFARRAGCTHAQGFLFGHPMPAAQFGALLHANAAGSDRVSIPRP
jgi:diguanylate cyclase (GGDEF)-like protein